MSFLNALASDGLSVGLRFYNARMNAQAADQTAAFTPVLGTEASPAGLEAPEEVKAPRRAAPPPPPQTPEEQAAGRAEAQARLTADGSLGQLQTTQKPTPNENQGQETAEADDAAESGAAQAAPASAQALSAEEEQEVARLKEQESQIKAEVQSSVRQGVEGADSVQYSYTTGPDQQRYINGIQGDQSGQGAPNPGASGAGAEGGGASGNPNELSEEERQQVEEMKQRDREVHTHEQAHVAAAAGLAGAPVYEYQTGPDGRRYAIGGHVDVRTSGTSNPDQALREAEAVKRAATAPAEPSSADRAAAASAAADINRLKSEKASGGDEEDKNQAAGNQGQLSADLKTDQRADEAANTQARNGSSFNQQVLGAYAAVKFGAAATAVRPVLAQI